MNIAAPRGTKDILPEEMSRWHAVENLFASVCQRYGYGEIRVPTFEQTELFARGVGGSTDIVRKEMYTFEDKGGRSMTLRPEGTAGIARAYIENGMASLPSPVKLYYDMSFFRYEKMQKGRYREFWQLGCENFGSSSAYADAEVIALLDTFFTELRLDERQLELGSIGCPDCRPEFIKALRAHFEPNLAKMCADCEERFELNPLRILDCKEEGCQPFIESAPSQLDYLCPDCADHFDKLKTALDELGIAYNINRSMVRGLDYYTRTVFEYVSTHVGTQGSICGGGRYDGLVEMLGGKATPAVGFAMGIERLLLEVEAQGVDLPAAEAPDLYIVSFPDTAVSAMALTQRLIRSGLMVQTDVMERSFRAQMKQADRSGARYMLLLGAEELSKREFLLKRLADGSEESVSEGNLVSYLKQVGQD
ncbi:MAG: histidine--tRNA ligase [Saccharofermentanales bacterium]|jgi:histidyl-tRNA synthetase|nr:histidine--tRNA ligase [Eubacteriales bacterium]MDD3611665.1 histidine--tRNA ligase [Eubacteriales bacterium]